AIGSAMNVKWVLLILVMPLLAWLVSIQGFYVGTESSGLNSNRVTSSGSLDMGFEPNQGQSNPETKFISRGRGYTLFLKENELVLRLKRSAVHQEPAVLRM